MIGYLEKFQVFLVLYSYNPTWHFLGSKAGIKHEVLIGVTIYEIVGLISSSLIISFIGIGLFELENIYFSKKQIILFLISSFILVITLIFISPYLMRKRGIITNKNYFKHSIINIAKTYLLYIFFFLATGLLFVLISSMYYEVNYSNILKIISIFTISWFVGFVIPGAPGGIGVRETAIIYFMAAAAGEGESVIIAIAIRFVTLLGDAWFFLINKKKFL